MIMHAEKASVLRARLEELLIDTDDKDAKRDDAAPAPTPAATGPPAIEISEGKWSGDRLGAAIVRLLAREKVSPCLTQRTSSLCLTQYTLLAEPATTAVPHDARDVSTCTCVCHR